MDSFFYKPPFDKSGGFFLMLQNPMIAIDSSVNLAFAETERCLGTK